MWPGSARELVESPDGVCVWQKTGENANGKGQRTLYDAIAYVYA